MKFIALLMVTILLGAIGMEEVKTTYAQPDRDEHLLTKEIVTGMLTQNIIADSARGIPLFEKYNFPLDVRKASDVSVYETSDGNNYFETIEKMKERIYHPVFAQAGSENLVRLTYKPNVRNLRQAPKYQVTTDTIPTFMPRVEGLPQDVVHVIPSYYWDGELEAFAFINTKEFMDDSGHQDVSRSSIDFYLMDKNAKIIKTRSFAYPTNVACKESNLGGSVSDYETNTYITGEITDGSIEPYTKEDGTFVIPDGIGNHINPRGVIVKIDLKSGGSRVVYEYPVGVDGYHLGKLFHTERYIFIHAEDRLVVFDKKYDKAHVFMGTTYPSTTRTFNPVLRSISLSVGVNTWDVFTFDENGITQIASKTKDEGTYFKYLVHWVGNLDYDYIIAKTYALTDEGVKRVESQGGRGHYQINFGNVEYDNSFRYTKNGQRAVYSEQPRDNYLRSNVDDGDIVYGFNGGDGYDYYAPDRKNFLPFVDVSETIRLWRKDKAVMGVSLGASNTTYNLFWYD